MKKLKYTWHQLDPGYGGYMSAEIGSGQAYQVFTSPISLKPQEEHRKILVEKICSRNGCKYGTRLRCINCGFHISDAQYAKCNEKKINNSCYCNNHILS